MAKYAEAAKQVRAAMRDLTPLVEPLSLDEAYLDLTGTERLHGCTPAKTMAKLARRIHDEIGITASIGLSHNKFLAKLASDLDKPRGFAVIGKAEAKSFLRDKPIGFIRGVGAATAAKLAKDGITRIAQLQDADVTVLAKRYGNTGLWLHRMANAEDERAVDPDAEMKSISGETTFETDIFDFETLEHILWDQAERVSARAKASEMGGRTVTLKLKTANFKTAHPQRLAGGADATGRPHLPHRARGAGARGRRHGVPASGRRHLQSGTGAPIAILPIWSTTAPASAPPPNAPWTRCARNSAARRWARDGG